jgi:hypothetical protein
MGGSGRHALTIREQKCRINCCAKLKLPICLTVGHHTSFQCQLSAKLSLIKQ